MQTPEQQARETIDRLLSAAGWTLQNKNAFNRHASLGVAVREYPLHNGPCDYLLFVDGKAAGVIEAKKRRRDAEHRSRAGCQVHGGLARTPGPLG